MKKKFSKKQIVIGVVGVLVFVVILGMIFGKPYPDKINLSDMTLNLEQEKDIKIKTTPSDANTDTIKCETENKEIAKVNGLKIEGVKVGKTKLICSYEDIKGTSVIEVKLSEKQKEQARKEQEKKEKELEEYRFTITFDDRLTLKTYAEDIVKNSLKSPKSAKFPAYDEWIMTKNNNLATVTAYVDADNSFGANIRNYFTIQVEMDDSGDGKVSYFEMDQKVYYGELK